MQAFAVSDVVGIKVLLRTRIGLHDRNMRIRQQDPVTKLWSMCEINSFLSAGGARCSIRIQWSEHDMAYAAPTV